MTPRRSRELRSTPFEIQCIDPFVVAYRGCPEFLITLAQDPDVAGTLAPILEHAHDRALAKRANIALPWSSERRRLSKREEEVLGLVAQGLTNREIAQTLFISEATAKVHVRHILEKLGVRTRTEAAFRASADSGAEDP